MTMRWYGLSGLVLSGVAIAGGVLLGIQWNKTTQLPYNLSIILSLSNAFWNYMLLGIVESLSLVLSLYCLQRAHVAWTVVGLLGVLAVSLWIAGSIAGAIRVQAFAYPVPLFLIALWLGMFGLSGALHMLGKRS